MRHLVPNQLHLKIRAALSAAFLGLATLASGALYAQVGSAEAAASGAIEFTQPDWRIVHCGVSKGVLYVSYIQDGTAAITPAFMTTAVRRACSAAGHPIQASAPARTRPTEAVPRIALPAPGGVGSTRIAVEPTFVARASGSLITIDARNDDERAYHCILNLSFSSDADASRSLTTQVTLPGRQANRVFTTGPHPNARFVRLTRNCSPGN